MANEPCSYCGAKLDEEGWCDVCEEYDDGYGVDQDEDLGGTGHGDISHSDADPGL